VEANAQPLHLLRKAAKSRFYAMPFCGLEERLDSPPFPPNPYTTSDKLVELVPNISEGQNVKVVDAIINDVLAKSNATLLHKDLGKDANRTVLTFVSKLSDAEQVIFSLAEAVCQYIDMRTQQGEHPRLGALDVCPIVPLQNTTMAECITVSKIVGERIANELLVPVYLYNQSAVKADRVRLANIRRGEYENLKNKLQDVNWQPDFYAPYNARAGAIVLGAREFLIAVNFSLNSNNLELAKKIAANLRKKRDTQENTKLSDVQFLAWQMKEYNCVQISTNITHVTAGIIEIVQAAINKECKKYGLQVTELEQIGLVPSISK